MIRRTDKFKNILWLLGIIALCGIVRLYFVFSIPFNSTVQNRIEAFNDEPSHLNYVYWLQTKHSLPILTHTVRDSGAFERNDYEYYQPPLYYIICAAAGSITGNTLYTARIISWIFGMASLWIIWLLFSYLNLSQACIRAAILIAGLSITHLYHCSVVSNDAPSWFICVLLVYELIIYCNSFIRKQPMWQWRMSAAIGLTIGIGLLIKSSIAMFLPVAFLCVLFGILSVAKTTDPNAQKVKRSILLQGTLLIGIVLVLSGPWYVRNLLVYNSLFALDVVNGPPLFDLWDSPVFFGFLKAALSSFWFPMQNVPDTIYRTIANSIGLVLLSAIIFLSCRHYLRVRKFTMPEWLLLSVLILNAIAYIQYNLHWTCADGRFLLPSTASLLYALIVPLYQFAIQKKMAWLFSLAIAVIVVYPYLYFLLI